MHMYVQIYVSKIHNFNPFSFTSVYPPFLKLPMSQLANQPTDLQVLEPEGSAPLISNFAI